MKPYIIKGGNFIDKRGKLEFFNDFDMSPIKRVYFTTHKDTQTIRAWQGHKIERRWFTCIQGSFILKLVEIDDWKNPSENLKVQEYKLSENCQKILCVPRGYVNGFRALEENSKMMIMADYRLDEIENDQVRYDYTKWKAWQN